MWAAWVERRMASISAGVSESMVSSKGENGAVSPLFYIKPVFCQNKFGSTALQEAKESGRITVLCPGHRQRQRIGYPRIEFLGDREEYFGLLCLERIGAVDKGA